ncbi:DUF3786 domain-containing protein [Thermodesulfobacteriota bacterium]
MARIDDYETAVNLGKEALRDKNPKRVADLSGSQYGPQSHGGAVLELKFLNKDIEVSWPDLEFSSKDEEQEISIQQIIILLHYLSGANGSVPSGDWIAYQEVPDGKFYLDAFLRRAKNPMVQAFGDTPQIMEKLASESYGARPFDQGDVSVVVEALPIIRVALILWRGDDEFPPEGSILFDRNIISILSAEDIAWLAGMIVYPLMGMARDERRKSKV